jgi:alkylation response protein AidB-like acyl-CoA dehydrogenase
METTMTTGHEREAAPPAPAIPNVTNEAYRRKLERVDMPPLGEMFQGLNLMKHIDPKYFREMEWALEQARHLARDQAAPLVLEVDRALQRDPENLEPVWELVRLAGRAGMFSLLIPKRYGGAGLPLFASAVIWEELCSVCSGFGNLVGAHYLGYLPLYASMKLRLWEKVCREIAAGEKSERPVTMSLSLTEPLVGSDHGEAELIPGAKIQSEATPVPGGYMLNGTKVFISNGSVSGYSLVIMPTDRTRKLETLTAFVVPSSAKGFHVDRDEHKMGQKACPATVMVYDDCFVPESNRVMPVGGLAKVLDIMGPTRICVGAISTGIARGAYEKARELAMTHTLRGRPIIQHQWAQVILSEMLMNVLTARATYTEAGYCDLAWGTGKSVPMVRGGYRIKQLADRAMDTEAARRFTDDEDRVSSLLDRVLAMKSVNVPMEAGYGSVAKVKCSDAAMINAALALDLAGKAGLRHDRGLEKIFRDAKLVQIYEGTNELNRLSFFQRFVAKMDPSIHVFDRE